MRSWVFSLTARLLFPGLLCFLYISAPGAAEAGAGDPDFEAWSKFQKEPVVRVRTVDKVPEIDGQMDELYKEFAEPLKFSFNDGFGGEIAEPTTAYLVSDKENLYLFANCVKAHPEKTLTKATQHDGDVWADEAVEIFIDPQHSRDFKYFHIMVNSAGVTGDVMKKSESQTDPSWNPALTVKCAKTKTSWTLEMKIPFAELGLQAGAINKIWSLNLTRGAHDEDEPDISEDTAWSPTRTRTSHKPSMFGHLWLDAGDKLNK